MATLRVDSAEFLHSRYETGWICERSIFIAHVTVYYLGRNIITRKLKIYTNNTYWVVALITYSNFPSLHQRQPAYAYFISCRLCFNTYLLSSRSTPRWSYCMGVRIGSLQTGVKKYCQFHRPLERTLLTIDVSLTCTAGSVGKEDRVALSGMNSSDWLALIKISFEKQFTETFCPNSDVFWIQWWIFLKRKICRF